ncbi:MAG TPA: NUDIX domain-containing protein [Acidimicrobiales bacterium]
MPTERTAPPAPIPGATVVPLRDGPAGLEVLLVQRAATIAYGGMWAFPGGRVEDRDAHPAHPGDDVARARRAAVREAEEEVGLVFPPDALVPLSHWTGGASTQGRQYAAWYFLAPAPPGAVVPDGRETLAHRWMAPAAAVASRDRGEIDVVAPTWVTLHTLTGAASVAGALALAAGRPPTVYVSRTAMAGDRRIVLWDGDAGYATADPDRPGPRHRLVIGDGRWTFERS